MEVDGLLEELICDESGRSFPISKSEYERYFFCYKQGLTRKSVDFRQIYLEIFIEDFSKFWKKRIIF